jgi:hypothetical protein
VLTLTRHRRQNQRGEQHGFVGVGFQFQLKESFSKSVMVFDGDSTSLSFSSALSDQSSKLVALAMVRLPRGCWSTSYERMGNTQEHAPLSRVHCIRCSSTRMTSFVNTRMFFDSSRNIVERFHFLVFFPYPIYALHVSL